MSDTTPVGDSRLAGLPLSALRDRLENARTSLRMTQNMHTRRHAVEEIEALQAEYKRRGYRVPS